jgi:pimeloyl-ACP methyl ester carboxylesterase
MTTQTLSSSTNTPNASSRKLGCRGLIKRVALIVVIGIIGTIALGFLYETVMQLGDAERYPYPGQMVSVDGYDMHLHCIGEGSPTVVFIGGAGALSYQDAPLQNAISANAENPRTCIYDRAGYLWSDSRPEARTAWQLMDELDALLTAAQIEPPYVLVGSSNGGIYARAYAYQHPDQVAGMVMVDSRIETELGKGGSLPVGMFQVMGRVGVFRLFPNMICPPNACDPAYAEEIAVFRGYASNLATYERELVEGLDGSPEQIALLNERLGAAGSLGDMPFAILAANQAGVPLEQADPTYRAFAEFYRDYFTALSSNSRYTLIEGGHGIAVEHPDIVLGAIEDVLADVRANS